jgi:hypothetical protein
MVMTGLTAEPKLRLVLGYVVPGPKMGQIVVPDLGLLKTGFSRNLSL